MIKNEDKIIIENVEVAGFMSAMRGMRNPMNSWHLNDSVTFYDKDLEREIFVLGNNDKKLATNLIKAGSEHCKFMRQIYIAFDITLPRYIWSEFDTYGFAPKNSCSTMHKLYNKKECITKDQFIYDDEDEQILELILLRLNTLRDEYLADDTTATRKNEIIRRAKQILPEGFLQKRTVATNYAVLRNIYKQRRQHRLKTWHIICDWIETLPCSELITM